MSMTEDYCAIEVLPFDDVSEGYYLLVLNDRKYKVSKLIADIVLLLKKGKDWRQISSILHIDFNKLMHIKQEYIDYLVLKSREKKDNYLFLELPIKTGHFITSLARSSSFLFGKYIFILLFVIGLTAIGIALANAVKMGIFGLNLNQIFYNLDFVTFLVIFFSLFFKSIIHELGHISALAYYGYKSKKIGVGIYLSFFVFFSDLDDAWRLKRYQRLKTNLGGVYFELLLDIFLLMLFFILHDAMVRRIILYYIGFNFISILYNLFPFFKFDGYWIMVDLFGISDLQKQIFLYLKNILYNMFKKPIKKQSIINRLEGNYKIFLLIYAGFFIAAFFYIIQLMLLFMYSYILKFGYRISHLWELGFNGIFHLIMGGAIFIGIFTWIIRKCYGFYKKRNVYCKENHE